MTLCGYDSSVDISAKPLCVFFHVSVPQIRIPPTSCSTSPQSRPNSNMMKTAETILTYFLLTVRKRHNKHRTPSWCCLLNFAMSLCYRSSLLTSNSLRDKFRFMRSVWAFHTWGQASVTLLVPLCTCYFSTLIICMQGKCRRRCVLSSRLAWCHYLTLSPDFSKSVPPSLHPLHSLFSLLNVHTQV